MPLLSRLHQVIDYTRSRRKGPPTLPTDAGARLRPDIAAQFRILPAGDQRHLLGVYRYLVALDAEDDTVTAGLLHDVGKACRACNVTIAHRAAHVLLNRLAPGAYGWLVHRESLPAWAKELRILATHPERGAEAARQAGYPERVVELIRIHERCGDPGDTQLALLRAADRDARPENAR